MYYALELNGRRRVAYASKTAGITEVTRRAYGPVVEDARVIKAHSKRAVAENALFNDSPQRPLKEAATL